MTAPALLPLIGRMQFREVSKETLMAFWTLLDGIADQPHAAELAGDEQAGHIGLEVGFDDRQLDAAGFRPEHQRDGVRGTGRLAGAMTDAARGLDQLGGPIIDNAEQGVSRSNLRTSANAGAAAQTLHGVDQGM